MSEYEVPQFIDRENKLLGPLTVRQVLILSGTLGVLLILFLSLAEKSMAFFIILAAIIGAGGFALAFLKFNGRGLSYFFLSLMGSAMSPSLYVWRKTQKNKKTGKSFTLKQKPAINMTKYKVQRLAIFLDQAEKSDQ